MPSAPIRTRDLTRQWRRGDAAKLARFMNESGRGWPGGGWDPKTPEEAERQFRDQKLLGAFVTEVGEEVISYCSLSAKPGERNRAYVPFLNAHPDYHGKGFGKAVLLSAIERVYELGIGRVDLGTWPGNLKAVPLYKKSGFMWSPAEHWEVLMQNFTPGARRHPIAEGFFRRHDWYRTMKRDLSLTADDHKRGKVRVYPYEWEENGDRLRMVYDRQSWGLLEVETNDFLLACFLEDEKLIPGLPHRIRWRIVNHGSRPLEVALVASADEGVKLDHKQILRVAKRADLSTDFEIDPEIPEKEKEPRAPIIRSDIILDGVPITLAAGLEAKQAVGFSLDSVGGFLRPGRPERVVIQGWSELDKPAKARVRIRGGAGARVEPATVTVETAAKGSAEVPVTVTADEPGVVHLKVESEVRGQGRKVRPKPADLYLHAGAPGQVLGHVEKDRVILESALLTVGINRRGGWVSIGDKVRNRWQVAGLPAPQIGPPFAWEDFFQSRCEARVEGQGDRAVAVLTTPSSYHPGIWLERRIAVSSLPVVEVSDTIINGSASRLEGRLRAGFQLRGNWMTVMTSHGIVRGSMPTGGRSPAEHRLPESGSAWPEGWAAIEDPEGVAAGLIWDQAHGVEFHGHWNSLDLSLPPAEPGQSATPGPFYLFVGDGDHFTVRRWWQTLFGPRLAREQRRPETRPAFDFGLRPRPLVLHGREARAKLVADPIGKLALEGSLRLEPAAGLRVQPRTADFRNASGARSVSRPLVVTRRAALPEGAYHVECTARIDRALYRERQPVIVLGDPAAKVTVSRAGDRGELFLIENARLALTIAPEFKGSAISLERDGRQLLRSAYPEARPLSWENPWYGGIEPGLGSLGRDLFKERFSAREVARRGSQGVSWRGVRVRCSPKQYRARHDTLSVDYLLAPGSDILAVVVRTTRRTDTAGWIDAGVNLCPVLGGSYLDAVISTSADARASRLRCDFGGWMWGDRWVIAENPRTADAVLLACHGGEASVGGVVFGRDGYFLNCGRRGVHEARESRESVFFIGFTETARARDLAEALSQLAELP